MAYNNKTQQKKKKYSDELKEETVMPLTEKQQQIERRNSIYLKTERQQQSERRNNSIS